MATPLKWTWCGPAALFLDGVAEAEKTGAAGRCLGKAVAAER